MNLNIKSYVAILTSVSAVTLASCSSDDEGRAEQMQTLTPSATTPQGAPVPESAPATTEEAEPTVATVALLDRVWAESDDRDEVCGLAQAGDFRTILKNHASDWDLEEVDAYFENKCAAEVTDPRDTATLLDQLWESTPDHERLCISYRAGDLTEAMSESELEWDHAVVDKFFSEKCVEVPDGSRGEPLPIDAPLTGGDWLVTIQNVNLNATDVVMEENRFNDPPAEGHQYVMFSVEMTYDGAEEPVNPRRVFNFAIVGTAGNTYDQSCGVIPAPMMLDVGDMYKGATAAANVCISAASEQLEGGTLRVGLGRGTPAFLALPTE